MLSKKFLSVLLVAVLVFSCCPIAAFADDFNNGVVLGESTDTTTDKNGNNTEGVEDAPLLEDLEEEATNEGNQDSTYDPDESIQDDIQDESLSGEIAEPSTSSSQSSDNSSSVSPQTTQDNASVTYQTHVSKIGWQKTVSNGATSGTSGKKLTIEALKITLTNTQYSGGVSYSTHVQKVGWQLWKNNGDLSGTTGKSLRTEAIKIKLTGEVANYYDIYYRVHSQKYGWLSWAKNGAAAGTAGCNFRMEAVQVVLVKKGAAAPGNTSVPYVSKASASYTAHVEKIGWQGWKSSGTTAGTLGKYRRIEAVKMNLNSNVSGGIEYNTHVQKVGWQKAVSNGALSGTTGKKLQVEAITIKLTGKAASYFDVYYRVHVQGYGWLGWAKNGAKAGTATCSYRMEGLQVVIVPKDASAPGSTKGAYQTKPLVSGPQSTMNAKASNKSSSTKWLLLIDSKNCAVGVYYGSKGNWTSKYYWACSPGKSSTPTVKGTFKVGSKGYSFGSGYTCYYWTQFYGNYLFHSVLYNQGTRTIRDGRLGQQLSHGCVRLNINNAKWIYDNIPRGTTVYSY